MPKYIDLTGKTFDRWTVLKHDDEGSRPKEHRWICQCSCEEKTVKSVLGRSLRRGVSTSCGCKVKENIKKIIPQQKTKTYESLIGQTFGRLTVIDKAPSSSSGVCYLCKCVCGNIHVSPRKKLMSGQTKSCGCLSKEINRELFSLDLTNKHFGRLIALKIVEHKNSCNIWLCKCECGNYCKVSAIRLNNGLTRSCGCLKSKGNSKIEQLLRENNINYKKEFTFPELVNPNTGKLLRYDFGILTEEGKLEYLIEYDGIQHFIEEGSGYYTKERLAKIKERDQYKTSFCKENNIPLIRIPYTHYEQLKVQDLVFSSSFFT